MEKALVRADTQRTVGVYVARFLFAEKALEPQPRRHLQRGRIRDGKRNMNNYFSGIKT